jgi:hypothetical protein
MHKNGFKNERILHFNKMPFGKFIPAKTETIKNMRGELVSFSSPAGYGGLFWGRVYDSDGNRIRLASDYFWDLGKVDHPDNDFKYWEDIDELIGEYCMKYIDPYSSHDHHYQYGFGGDESDGLIDFWVKDPIPEMPDMQFEIAGKMYVIKWDYSSGDD